MRLLIIHEVDQTEWTFVMMVTEDYHLIISDFTDHEYLIMQNVVDEDLMPIIRRDIGWYSHSDLLCNGLTTIIRDEIYMLPCRASPIDFTIWIKLTRSRNRFEVSIFAKIISPESQIHEMIGISAFERDNIVHLISSFARSPSLIQYLVLDISQLDQHKITQVSSLLYKSSNFEDPLTGNRIEQEFNIRDVVSYSPIVFTPSGEAIRVHHLIVSCNSVGLYFFKALNVRKDISDINNSTDENWMNMNLTSIHRIRGIGRIWTEKLFGLQEPIFLFFTSTSTPPAVQEFAIDHNMNMFLIRVYRNANEEVTRYVGNDEVTSNHKFVIFLVYDNWLQRQVLRVFYRHETNFNIGHTEIVLNDYDDDVSGFTFLSFFDFNRVYVRNSARWDVFEIFDTEFLVNTADFIEEYRALVGTRFSGNIQACTMIPCNERIDISFELILTDHTDMNTYLVVRNEANSQFLYSFGNPRFEVMLTDSYVGPDMMFKMELNYTTSGRKDIILPRVVNNVQGIIITKHFNETVGCQNAIFKRFEDPATEEVMISFFCIQPQEVEHHTFRAEDLKEIGTRRREYRSQNFIGFVREGAVSIFVPESDVVFILSEERGQNGETYIVHRFNLRNNLLIWASKIPIDTKGLKIRRKDPFSSLPFIPWLVFVIEGGYKILMIPEDPSSEIIWLEPKREAVQVFS